MESNWLQAERVQVESAAAVCQRGDEQHNKEQSRAEALTNDKEEPIINQNPNLEAISPNSLVSHC